MDAGRKSRGRFQSPSSSQPHCGVWSRHTFHLFSCLLMPFMSLDHTIWGTCSLPGLALDMGTGSQQRLPWWTPRCRASSLGTDGLAHGLPQLKVVHQVSQHLRTHALGAGRAAPFLLPSALSLALSLTLSRTRVLSLGNAYTSILSTQHGAMSFLHKDHSAHLREIPLFPHASVSPYVRHMGIVMEMS